MGDVHALTHLTQHNAFCTAVRADAQPPHFPIALLA